MTRAIEPAGAIAVLVCTIALCACAAPHPSPTAEDPGAVALQLFSLPEEPPQEGALAQIFDPDALSGGRVSLLDALEALAGFPPPELLAVEAIEGDEEAFADLAVELPGGGRAAFSVKLRRLEAEGWRVAWFQGPGVEWPSRGRRGESLSTSSPP